VSGITTHVLDTGRGRPAHGVPVVLERRGDEGWERAGAGATGSDGRTGDLAGADLQPGTYRLTFDTGAYDPDGFYPEVVVAFSVTEPSEHHHVPLLLSPYSYTTYRGS
jgi:5-hydroxyisourate hydrolase